MRPKYINWEFRSDTDAIAQAQTLADAGYMTLNGIVATAPFGGTPHLITLTTATSDHSGVTFTVVGEGKHGEALTEDIAGPNNNTVKGSTEFYKITSVYADGAVATNGVSVGMEGSGVVINIPLDPLYPAWTFGFYPYAQTVTYTLKYTQMDIFRRDDFAWSEVDWTAADATQTDATGDTVKKYDVPMSACQITIGSVTANQVNKIDISIFPERDMP